MVPDRSFLQELKVELWATGSIGGLAPVELDGYGYFTDLALSAGTREKPYRYVGISQAFRS